MQVTKKIIILPLLFLATIVYSQKGTIRGSVFDGETGEFLPGVTIFVEGTTSGTTTDLDGKFSLDLKPGIYKLRVSFVSYAILSIDNVEVKEGEITLLDNLKLVETAIKLEETVIRASVIRNTEAALLTMKQKSANVIDGISAIGLRKIGDSNVASSVKRITGVSVEGGKYVYVRGLGDRYTKTIMNGLDIPGLDPDRNTIQMDIFPTSIVGNIVVNKSFSADLPADFTGGVINITIKDFPDKKEANFSVGAAYNPNAHFNNNYLTYEGGKTDWLGFDDGTRDIPAISNIPFFADVISQSDPVNSTYGLRFKEILKSFNPIMAAKKQKSFMDYSIGSSYGNQFKAGKFTLGTIVSLSYKNNTDFYDNAEYGRYGLVSGNPDITELEKREQIDGSYGVNTVLWSALAGFALKTKQAKYRINLMHIQNGESKAGIFNYNKTNLGTTFSGFQHTLEYTQRSLSNILLEGKYATPNSNWNIEWKFSPTFSKIESPDVRFTRYEDRNGKYSIGTEVGFPERIWRDLEELNLSGALHITKDFKIKERNAKLKFGGAYVFKERDYNIRSFAINIRGDVNLTGDPNEIFEEGNLWPYMGNTSSGTTYEAAFIPDNPNQYNSNVHNAAAYLSLELNLLKNLKMIAGLRVENYVQRYTGQDQLKENVLDNDIVLDNIDYFPTINIIYNVSEKQNLRFSYAKTIARPSFKELSYSQIFDPISGRTFIGGLFKDENLSTGIVYWDGKLIKTDIHNLDIRWELFPGAGQTLSISGFYKKFINPIELVQYARVPGSFQPRNVGDANVYGGELEFRQKLSSFASFLKGFSLNVNFTYTKSEVELSEIEYNSRVGNARTGQTIDREREMSGLAPYIINAGLAYDGGKNGFWKDLEAGLYYNIQGRALQYVGIADRPDIYSKPFHSLNFNGSKKFGKKSQYKFGLKVDNILGQEKESIYKSFKAADQNYSRINPGTTVQVKFSYSF